MRTYPTENIRQYAEQLNNRPFRVSLFGKMKTGKSSLLNALLGANILPVKTITATAVRTNVSYGDTTSAEVVFGNDTKRIMSIEAARKYIVHTHGQTNEVSEVNITIPCRLCEHNVILTDTPGIDDLAELNEVSERVIKDTDFAIMVFDATRFIAAVERKFCTDLCEQLGGNIIFVINKTDNTDMEDLRETANIYLRTYGNAIIGKSKIIYTATPDNAVPQLDGLPALLQHLLSDQCSILSVRARNSQLLRFSEEQLTLLLADYERTSNDLHTAEQNRSMGYIARLNKARSRLSELVMPFDEICRSIIDSEGGLLTMNNMVYCLNSVASTFISQFNSNLNKLRLEFGISSTAKVAELIKVTPQELENWGIGVFYDDERNRQVFNEIIRTQRIVICNNIEKTFSEEEQSQGARLADSDTFSTSPELKKIQKKIVRCEKLIRELKDGLQ